MKPHGMRRSIWFLNVFLGAAVIGVAAWYVFDVREAVANTPRPQNRKAPKKWAAIVNEFNKQIEGARTDVLRPPVLRADVEDAFKTADYKKREPSHFIFTGEPPPPEYKKPATVADKPPPPKGLDAIGRIAWLIWSGAEGTTVVFEFNDKKRKFFNIGDFVNANPKSPENRFKLTKAMQPEEDLYKIEYEVWEGGKKVATETASNMTWDNRREPPDENGVIRIIPKTTAESAAEGEGEATAAPKTADGSSTTSTEKVEDQPKVIVVGGSDLTAKDLKPEIKVVNARLREVRFDENTFKYFKARDVKKMVENVKTREVPLPGGKKGVQIVDPGEAPADVFDLRRGDVIVSINGQPTPDRASIIRIAEAIGEDATRVTIVVDRNGRSLTFNVDPRDPKVRRRAARYGEGTSGR